MICLHGADGRCRRGIASAQWETTRELLSDRRGRRWNTCGSSRLPWALAFRWAPWSLLFVVCSTKKSPVAHHGFALLGAIWFGVDGDLRIQGAVMDLFVVFLIFTVGLLLGCLLVPLFDLLGLVMVVGVCSLLLGSWVCWNLAKHSRPF